MWFKFRFTAHYDIKPKLLELLNEQNCTNDKTGYSSNEYVDIISKTDWYVDSGLKRLYWDFLEQYIFHQLKSVYDEQFEYENFSSNSILNYWFQQYSTGDIHGWHRHGGSSFSNIYYVELPKDAPVTELKIPISNQIVRPNVQEGDVLIFPSCIFHRSPPNESKDSKTVISFNVY